MPGQRQSRTGVGGAKRLGRGDVSSGAGFTLHATPEVTPEVTGEVTGEVGERVARLLVHCEEPCSRKELQQAIGIRHEDHFRAAYLLPALEARLLERTIPDKPQSSKQRTG